MINQNHSQIPTSHFKSIVGYENLYSISRDGKILAHEKIQWGGRSKRRQKFLKPALNSRRYLLVWLYKEGKKRSWLIHRLVALTYIPNPLGFPVINHKNNVRHDNCVENLEWCTMTHNIRDAFDKERMGKKLSYIKANRIREEYKTGEYKQSELAKKYKVSRANMCLILNKKIWARVPFSENNP